MNKLVIEKRLSDLRQELHNGQVTLMGIESRRSALQSQMLRINGAIQVLEELLTTDNEKQKVSEISPKAVGE